MQLAWTQLIVAKHIPYEYLERKAVFHCIHADEGSDFERSLRGA
jgi:hypothetical protein